MQGPLRPATQFKCINRQNAYMYSSDQKGKPLYVVICRDYLFLTVSLTFPEHSCLVLVRSAFQGRWQLWFWLCTILEHKRCAALTRFFTRTFMSCDFHEINDQNWPHVLQKQKLIGRRKRKRTGLTCCFDKDGKFLTAVSIAERHVRSLFECRTNSVCTIQAKLFLQNYPFLSERG